MSEEERDRHLSRASVLAFGGIEDFGIIFVEAMAAGLPIAGIRDGGLAEIALYGGAAFAEEPSAEGLAGAIERCLAHPEEIAAPKLACRCGSWFFGSSKARSC